MAHLCLAVMGKKPGTPGVQWVYLRKSVQTFLTYETGTGFGFPYSNGDYWRGTVHHVMNYTGVAGTAPRQPKSVICASFPKRMHHRSR